MTIALYIFLGTCIVTLIGWIAITRNAHVLAIKRDHESRNYSAISAKKDRTRTFLAFLKQWHSELSTFRPKSGLGGGNIFEAYQTKLPKFHSQVALISGDFTGDQAFERLTGRLGSLNQPDMASQNKAQKIIILEAIDELIKHTDATGDR